jgi:mannosyl-oligosaccharide alpha-1,2-mannosidase
MKMLSRWRVLFVVAAIFLIFLSFNTSYLRDIPLLPSSVRPAKLTIPPEYLVPEDNGKYNWAKVPQNYPASSFRALPTPTPGNIPTIQAAFKQETGQEREQRLRRLDAVKGNFSHAWYGYKKHAWLRDEVAPISGRGLDPFGGWAATLVDSLGTPKFAQRSCPANLGLRYPLDHGSL